MHENRKIYTLPSYQEKLRKSYLKLGILIYNKSLKKSIIIRPIPTNVWLPESREKYFKKLEDRTKNIIQSKHYTFCTLTYSNKKYTPGEAAKRVKHDIDLFFKRLNYRKSKPAYFYMIELTDNFMVHVHLIFDRYVHKSKVFMSWFKVTGSISIRIKHKKKGSAMQYCLKYLRKTQKQDQKKWEFIFKNIDRIWSSSRDFFTKIENPDTNWLFLCMAWNKNNSIDRFFSPYDMDFVGQEFNPEESIELVDFFFWEECVISTGNQDHFYEVKAEFEKLPF